MSVKTCQLCGKALSRMRVGSDGDFCSREHRNQFRLRKGMDRLMEANKVASLMRRRENPKQIPLAQLLASPVMQQRVAPELSFPARRFQSPVPRIRPAVARTAVSADRRLISLRNRAGAPAEPRMMSSEAFPFPPRFAHPKGPGAGNEPGIGRVARAEAARILFPRSRAAGKRRECQA